MQAEIGFNFEKAAEDVISRRYEDAVSMDKSFRKENPLLYNRSFRQEKTQFVSTRSFSPKASSPKVTKSA
jgi:hypothetical protein